MTYDLSDQTEPLYASEQYKITQLLFNSPPCLSKYYCVVCMSFQRVVDSQETHSKMRER